MFHINSITVMGRLGADAELKYTQNGTAVMNLNVATEHSFKKNDKWEKTTTWHRVVGFGKPVENLKEYAKKGGWCVAQGRLEMQTWQDKQGQQRQSWQIVADTLQVFQSRTEAKAATQAAAQPEPEFTEDNIQF
jgi:single-strand DNA-binding protein